MKLLLCIWSFIVFHLNAINIQVQSGKFNDEATEFHVRFTASIKLKAGAVFLDSKSFAENLFADNYETTLTDATASLSNNDDKIIIITLGTSDAVYPGGSLTIYVNTLEPVDPVTYQFGTTEYTFTLNNADSDSGTSFMRGNIAIVMVYNKSLSDAEITQNFNAQRYRFGR